MRAARLHEGHRLRIESVPVPELAGDQVLVRVAGAGVCRSDLHVLDGMLDEYLELPVTMGHEIAGRVAGTGPDVSDLAQGQAVVVMVGWGCGHCRWCVSGHEQLCPQGVEAGSTADGGFAEFVLVPHRRHVVPLRSLDPVAATPLGCAALSAYAAVKRVRPHLAGAARALVIGAGGLGHYAIQLLGLYGAEVLAVDPRPERRERALALGAARALEPEAAEGLADVDAVLDFVGTDESLALAVRSVGRRGIVALLGLAGGSTPFGFYATAPEATLTTVWAGTIADLHEVVELAEAGRISAEVRTYPLESVDEALDDLRAGRIPDRAALVP
jgi:propanol-preferring alcohol dehydrogenase